MKKINGKDESKIAGGAIINGEQKTLLEPSETKMYEYKCDWCGKISYRKDDSRFSSCPHCNSFFNYSATGKMLFDYDYVNDANWRSYENNDT